jgi:hypothetical protein
LSDWSEVTEIPSAVDECSALGELLSLLAAVQRHDERLSAADRATAERLAALGASAASGDAEELLAAECTACRETGRACASRCYRAAYRIDGRAPESLHPELRQLLDALGLDLGVCCVACSHDQHGHLAHDLAVRQVRAERHTDPLAALAALERRRFDSLADASNYPRKDNP